MSESRNPPAGPPHPRGAAAPSPGRHGVRWRDIEWVEFEPAARAPIVPSRLAAPLRELPLPANDAAPEPASLDGPEVAEPVAVPGPDPAPPPRPAPPPPQPGAARLRMPGGGALLRGPLPPARGRRGLRAAGIAAAVGVGAILAYGGVRLAVGPDDARAPAPPPREAPPAPAPAPPPQVPAPASVPAPAAAAPQPPLDRTAALTEKAEAGDAAAQFNLAVLYARGDGVAQDYARAASWFREAAINGNVPAQFNLGVLYERGLGMAPNINEALIWYHSAAAHNYPPAEYNLALSYADGRGTPQDFVAAARWYRRAAEGGVVPAMINLAILLETGRGGPPAPVEAYAWYRAAGARGDEPGEKRAGELFAAFSAADKARAEAAAAAVAASIHPPPAADAAKPGSAA